MYVYRSAYLHIDISQACGSSDSRSMFKDSVACILSKMELLAFWSNVPVHGSSLLTAEVYLRGFPAMAAYDVVPGFEPDLSEDAALQAARHFFYQKPGLPNACCVLRLTTLGS